MNSPSSSISMWYDNVMETFIRNHRSYNKTTCKRCGSDLVYRTDYKEHKGYCSSCIRKKIWEDPEYKKRMSVALSGTVLSEETKKRMSEAKKGKTPKNLSTIQQDHKLKYGEASSRAAYRHKKRASEKRNHVFDISYEQYFKIVILDCIYCGASPSQYIKPHSKINGEFVHNGIDRVNNDLEYIDGNCVPCCRRCNSFKKRRTVEQFKEDHPAIFTESIDSVLAHLEMSQLGSNDEFIQ